MKGRVNTSWVVVALGVASLVGSGFLHARTLSVAAPVKPTAVAIVNLDEILAKLKEVKDREAQIGAVGQERAGKVKEAIDKVNKLGNELKLMKTDNPDFARKRAELVMAAGNAEGLKNGLKQQQDFEQAQEMGRLYLKVCARIEAIAKRDGWGVVLQDDRFRRSQLEGAASAEQAGSLIQNIKILNAGTEVDITQQVIAEMDAEYAAPAKK